MYAALDIGGTKIAGALVDEAGSVVRRVELPTPARESEARLATTLDAVIDALAAEPAWSAVRGLGIASAGPVDTAAGTVSPVNIPAWRQFPLVESVRSHHALPGSIEPVLLGDAVAVAAAEHWHGAAQGVDHALCMVVSTGVGGGYVLGGRLYPGPSGNAGHIGHISVELDGPPCACGGRGCLEAYASGTAIARHAQRAGWAPPRGCRPPPPPWRRPHARGTNGPWPRTTGPPGRWRPRSRAAPRCWRSRSPSSAAASRKRVTRCSRRCGGT